MSADLFADETVGTGAKRGPEPTGRAARGVEVESMTIGSGLQTRRDAAPGAEPDDIVVSKMSGRGSQLSEGARKLLEQFERAEAKTTPAAPAAPPESPPAAAATPDAGATQNASPGATSAAAATAVSADPAKPAEPAKPDPAVAEHETRMARLLEHNTRLLSEVESLRGKQREPGDREKALLDVANMAVEKPVQAIRKLIALAHGIEDDKSKDIDEELSGIYKDLTELELGVSLDTAAKAERESKRTRRIMERDKRDMERERKAAEERAKQPAAGNEDEANHRAVASFLATKGTDGKSPADEFPVTMKVAAKISGVPVEKLVWNEIRRAVQTGALDPKSSDADLIKAASKSIEQRFQALRDVFTEAFPTSTATPAQATGATESKADPASNGVRTITNASASVAPATPPASKPAPTVDKPKFRNEKERILALARKHAGEA